MAYFRWTMLIVSLCIMLMQGAFQHALAQNVLKAGVTKQSVQAESHTPGIIGVNFLIRANNYPQIMEVYPGTPAQRANLTPGDQVISINNVSTQGLNAQQVDDAISDVPGERVKLMIRRSKQVFPVTLTVMSADQLQSPSLKSLYSQLLGY